MSFQVHGMCSSIRIGFIRLKGSPAKRQMENSHSGDLKIGVTGRKRPIKHFSGKALYKKVFEVTDPALKGKKEIFLDLGKVHETARVRLNGKDLGVLWCQPWHVNVSGVLKNGENFLEVEVVNLWPNRLIGDDSLPEGEENQDKRNNL